MLKSILPRTMTLTLFMLLGCADWFAEGSTLPPQEVPDSISVFTDLTQQTLFGKGPGESCGQVQECRIGLDCVNGVCTISGDRREGEWCVLSADCGDGLVCSVNVNDLTKPKVCVPEGDGVEGSPCTTNKDCKKGFYCQLISFSGVCKPAGEGDVGDNCNSTGDCLAGLHCGVDGQCGIMGAQLPLYPGVECEPSTALGDPPRVLFEIPPEGTTLKDFYRLPFPNDARIGKNGKLDLTGHPTPGPGVVGYDIAARVMKAIQEDLGAYGTNPVVFFRFSHTPDLDTIKTGKEASVLMVDITSPSEKNYGKPISINWVANTGRGKFICQNYLAVYPPWGRPLKGEHTYAVLVLNSVRTLSGDEQGAKGEPYQQDKDFKVMMSDAYPEEKALRDAWERYTPLRQFLASGQAANLGISKFKVAGATVFTTYDPTKKMAKLKEKIDTIDLPSTADVVLCEDGAVSPCDDGLLGEEHIRGCFGSDPDFYEIQGLVSLPMLQEGNVPYIDPADGGGVEWDALGQPVIKRYEEVCFSLTVPKSEPPPEGWPVVLYAHGTGGNYRSHVTEGISARLSKFDVWDEDTQRFTRPVGMAVFGWDQVMHGPRVGPEPLEPEALVLNFRNPRAALGNFYQAAAEAMILARFLATWNTASPKVEGLQVSINPMAVQFLGHSQGGILGPLAMPFVDAVSSMVITSTGGGLIDSLLKKTKPSSTKDGIIMVLQDSAVGRTHPLLALMQNYYDAVDPINYAHLLFYTPYKGHKVRTLHTFSLEDEMTPPSTMEHLSQAMRAMLARALSLPDSEYDPYSGVQQVELPYKVSGGITVQYKAPPQGGQYVIFHDEDAIRHYTNFFGTAALDGTPWVVK